MKKLRAILITSAISLSIFSGCTSNNSNPEKTAIETTAENTASETTTENTDSYADDKTLDEFNSVFEELLAKFDKVSAAVVSADGSTLKPEYSEYQSDFDKILEEIDILGDYIDENGTDNEYFTKMTEKGRNILELLNNFSSKAGL